MTRLIGHLRNNAVGYIALTVALGGTSYAATTPMITRAQIQNHSIQPVKLGPNLINGNVRAWAIIGPAGHVIASGGKPKVTPQAGDPGGYGIRWGVKVGRCDTVATIDLRSSPPTERLAVPGNPSAPFTAGYAVASTVGALRGNETFVQTFNQLGQPTPLGFNVTVIC
jgi:hypothetical protein